MELVQFGGFSAIRTVIPDAVMVGPDPFTCESGGDCTTEDAWGHSARWLIHWTDSLLRYFDTYFNTFSVHNFGPSDWDKRTAVGNVWEKMVQLGRQRQIWLTEFNFKRGTCDFSEQTILDRTRAVYNTMTWERSFYFNFADNDPQACGWGLLHSASFGFAQKSILYPGFRSMVIGGGCSGKPCGSPDGAGGTCCAGSGCTPVFCGSCEVENACGSECEPDPFCCPTGICGLMGEGMKPSSSLGVALLDHRGTCFNLSSMESPTKYNARKSTHHNTTAEPLSLWPSLGIGYPSMPREAPK